MKGEGKMVLNSRMKWVGLVGLVLSAFSLFIHFLLARFSAEAVVDYQSSITLFSWRPIFESPLFPITSPMYRRLWGPVRRLEFLHPDANPRGHYADVGSQTNGFIFVRIQGGFHEIRNSICDVVVVSRLLNATLVIPEIQSTTSKKGIRLNFLQITIMIKHSVVELVVSEGGCLQATLPPQLQHNEELQRLRCRVAFHALRFRQEVQELATKILLRLRAPGRPFIAYDPGMTRDALAYHGCAELFQDVHTELIQHKRSWMMKRGIVKGKLPVNSAKQRLNGSCPLMPEEVGILLRAYGYSWDTIIYVSGGEVFGGQRTLIPLHSMFENVVDRTSLSTPWELTWIYGREANLVSSYPSTPPSIEKEMKHEAWKTAGPRPRPLPPPPARPKSYNIEGWWGWVAESDNEPESTVMELRTNAHKLLWEAIDYVICIEADVFIPGFDRDGKGHPNFASLVMGHRLYQSAALKTYRPDRKEVAKLFEKIQDHLYHANHTWLKSVRKHMRKRLIDGLIEASTKSKPMSFLSHPVPECSCLMYDSTEIEVHASSPSTQSQVQASLGIAHQCPAWMKSDLILRSKDKDNEEDLDEDDSTSSGLFFRQGGENHESGGGESNNKEEAQMDDQEELEGGER
ncbi:o-fucosyltransferase 27 [Quercus suber]|uniref:O-fucosyltransferase family protein n=1 Tax=Quercus suber TaxID=58331 RepID=A0AAW0KU67_QUESU